MTATEKASAKRRRRYPTFPALVAQGKTREEIEATLGISEYTARLLKAAFGITGTSEAFPGPGVRPSRPPRPERTPTITRAEIEARTHQRYEGVVAALQQRRTSADIAKEFGVTPQRVRQIAKKFGVKRPPVRLPKSRNAAGLTAWQQRQVENHPEILDASIPNSKMPGIGHTAVRNIRRALGMPATVKSSPVRDRIVAVVIRPMTVAEIATAIGSESMVALRLCLSVAARKGYINRVSLGVYAPTWWPMDGEK